MTSTPQITPQRGARAHELEQAKEVVQVTSWSQRFTYMILGLAAVWLFSAFPTPPPRPQGPVREAAVAVQMQPDSAQLDGVHSLDFVVPQNTTAVAVSMDGQEQTMNVPAGRQVHAVFRRLGPHHHTWIVTLRTAEGPKQITIRH